MSTKKKPSPESIVREIKRKTCRKYSAEEKIRIVLEGLRGEQSLFRGWQAAAEWGYSQRGGSLS